MFQCADSFGGLLFRRASRGIIRTMIVLLLRLALLHRMGVKQRERLMRNVKAPPHMLMMTATPIPRTLAIMQYGGMLFSDIKSLPPGRTPVETHVLPDDVDGRYEVIRVQRHTTITPIFTYQLSC